MSEIKVGDKVKIIRHKDYPNEIWDKGHFAIGSVHTVKGIDLHDHLGVYLRDEEGDDYLILWAEIEKVQ
ncbi:gp21 [Shigella phage Buco]|uniref:Uncharacterized protein n=1 Tax=Shigella phage Buco TaxID=2530183 RepID=A0A482JGP7_9CAUD|nr:gp21 [Shigella phage Buco]QBP32921.1 hypothetical protein HRP29_gp21 [Shigella phage Buco]